MTLAEAEAAERAAFAEIGRLGEREFEAVLCWIASGCEGEQPKPDQEARLVLADRLSAAMAARETAEKGAGWRGVRRLRRDSRHAPALWWRAPI